MPSVAEARAAGRLVASGQVRVLGVWPRAVEAEVIDERGSWRCRFRRGSWSCPCGRCVEDELCVHALAVQLVARPLGRVAP